MYGDHVIGGAEGNLIKAKTNKGRADWESDAGIIYRRDGAGEAGLCAQDKKG